MTEGGVTVEIAAVIDDLEIDVVGTVPDAHACLSPCRVFERVGQGLLHDPVGSQVDAARQRRRLALNCEVDVEARTAQLLGERRHIREAGLWRACGFAVGGAQDTQQPSKLVDCFTGGRLDRQQRFPGSVRVAVEQHSRRPGLHTHQAHAVSDYVVQLASDPRPFINQRRASPFAINLQLSGASRQARCQALTPRCEPAQRPRSHRGDDAEGDLTAAHRRNAAREQVLSPTHLEPFKASLITLALIASLTMGAAGAHGILRRASTRNAATGEQTRSE